MSWGRKKKQEEKPVTIQPPKCQHLWKDFPWYFKSVYNQGFYGGNNNLSIKIYEPYVCARCKERKDILLEDFSFNDTNLTYEKALKKVEHFEEKYKGHWAERAIVEDMIFDFQMVDRQALEWLGYLKKFGQEDGTKLVLERGNGEKVEVKLGD